MDIKYTLEILTKDIQDIEKLVGNLQNSQDGSAIELDLALSKMRNVYEILTMIKADRLHEMVHPWPFHVDPVISESIPAEIQLPDPEPIPDPPRVVKKVPETKAAEIVAEKFSTESSINENLAVQRDKNTDSKFMGQPIDQISRNIGINDRFLIIRELFAGNSDQFNKLVNSLDGAGNYQTAIGLLNDQFAESKEHEGVEILTRLIKRRYSHS